MKKMIMVVSALTIGLAGCATNSMTLNQSLKQHKEMKIAYTRAGQELAKEYNFYFRTLFRDEKTYGMKFIVNDQVIEEDIDWVHFDSNSAVYQLDKADDIREQASMTNPHYLLLNGKKYETDDSDNFYVLSGKLIHFRCLEQKYDPEFDRNTCIDRAIYADEILIDSMKTDSRRFNSIEFSFRDGSRIYYSKIVEEPHDVFDFDYNQTVSLYYYDADNGEKKLYGELPSKLYASGLLKGELVLGSYNKSLRAGQQSFGVNAVTAKVIDGNLYYIPSEDSESRIEKNNFNKKRYISLIKNKEKIGSVFTDSEFLEIEDGRKAFCGSFINPLFTEPLCVFGNNFFAKSQVGSIAHSVNEQKRGYDDLDEFYINGSQVDFYPYFDIAYKDRCDAVFSDSKNAKEFVDGIGFLFDNEKALKKLLIVSKENCYALSGNKLYMADYQGGGKIGQPTLLAEYDGEFFGYTRKP